MDDSAIIHLCLWKAGTIAPVLRREQTLFSQRFQADQKRVPSKRGEDLVGRVTISSRPERKHLPDALLCCVKKVGKTEGLTAKIADTEAARKRGRMKENSARTGTFHGGIICAKLPGMNANETTEASSRQIRAY